MRNGAPYVKGRMDILKWLVIQTTLVTAGFVKLVKKQRTKQRHMKAKRHDR